VTTSTPGESIVVVTIWTSLVLYAIGDYLKAKDPHRTTVAPKARFALSLGAVSYLVHVATAFEVHYDWNHATAYTQTAIQTSAATGMNWGGGIWINYAFTALWISEVLWWWVGAENYRHRPRLAEHAIRGIFLFMILNGAVLFVDNPMRWAGIAIALWLIGVWYYDVVAVSRTPLTLAPPERRV
jgi:hypothetical protein